MANTSTGNGGTGEANARRQDQDKVPVVARWPGRSPVPDGTGTAQRIRWWVRGTRGGKKQQGGGGGGSAGAGGAGWGPAVPAGSRHRWRRR